MDPKIGVGGAPTRETTLPADAAARKQYPVASGVLDYFPDALVAIAQVSWAGNEQHNPGQPLHWNRAKSGDESDAAMRHFLRRGTRDSDNIRHTAKWAWRALAFLQKEIEDEQAREALQSAPVEFGDEQSIENYKRQIAAKKDQLVQGYFKGGKARVGRGCSIDAAACFRKECVEQCAGKLSCEPGQFDYDPDCADCRAANA